LLGTPSTPIVRVTLPNFFSVGRSLCRAATLSPLLQARTIEGPAAL